MIAYKNDCASIRESNESMLIGQGEVKVEEGGGVFDDLFHVGMQM